MNSGFSSYVSDLALQVEHIIHQLDITPSDNLRVIPKEGATYAVVQLQMELYHSLSNYVLAMNNLVADAVNRRSHIICFPAFTGWLSLPFASNFQRLFPEIKQHLSQGRLNPVLIRDFITTCSSEMMEVYMTTMRLLAEAYGIYIMTGSVIYTEMHQMYHHAFLLDNFGLTVGLQGKVLPSALEKAFRIEPEHEIKVFDTALGSISMLITSDVNTFEPARIASNLGAKILLCPDTFIGKYTPTDSADGLNLRILENSIYGVQPTLVGNTGFGFSLGKPSAVYAPPYITYSEKTDSILYKTYDNHQTELLIASLNYNALENKSSLFVKDSNPAFIEKNTSLL